MAQITVKKFYGVWCGPCKILEPMFEEVKKNYGYSDGVTFENIDVDEQFEIASKYGVKAVPLVVIEKDGKEVQRFNGVQSVLTYRNAINENLK